MKWKTLPFHPILASAFCVASLSLWAQTAVGQSTDASKSWTSTTEPQVSVHVNPTRVTETHSQAGDRTVDTQSVEQFGTDGHFQPSYDVEKESVRVNATTLRTVVRTFGRDGGGHKTLTQVTEESRKSLPDGAEEIVRTTSIPDQYGHLPITQRETTSTRITGPDAQETKTTVFITDGSGGLAPSVQTVQHQTRASDHTIAVQKTTRLIDGAGKWQIHELKETTITENGNDRTTEERVSVPEYDGGKLSVISHTVAKDAEAGSGARQVSDETYSTYIPGSAPDGKLHLSQRATIVSRPQSNGSQLTEQQVEQPNFGDPNADLQLTGRTIEIVSTDSSGKLQTRTIQGRDGGGHMRVVSVDVRKSNQTRAVQVDTTPQNKPK